jgi:transcriptional regulator with XRE-family HTH domain
VTHAHVFAKTQGMPAKLPPKSAIAYRAAFARRLAAAREASGYATMREFADALGVSEARYRRWEAAETEPDIYHMQKIARLTGASLDSLISGDRRSPAAA